MLSSLSFLFHVIFFQHKRIKNWLIFQPEYFKEDVYKLMFSKGSLDSDNFIKIIEGVRGECDNCYWLLDEDYDSIEGRITKYIHSDMLIKRLSESVDSSWLAVIAIPKNVELDLGNSSLYEKGGGFLLKNSEIEIRMVDGEWIEIATRSKNILNILYKKNY